MILLRHTSAPLCLTIVLFMSCTTTRAQNYDNVVMADAHVHLLDFLQNGDYLEGGEIVPKVPGAALVSGELLFKAPMKGGAATAMTFSFAYQILPLKDGVLGKRKLFYEPFRLAGCGWDRLIPRPWDVRELRRPRTKQIINHWAHITLAKHGKALSTEEWERIGKICFPTAPRPDLSAKRLFKSDLIRTEGEKRIDEILEEKGITVGAVLDVYEEAYKLTKAKGDALNIISVADRYSELVQKYRRVDEHFDETIEIDDTPLEQAPVPKRLNGSVESGGGLIERKL